MADFVLDGAEGRDSRREVRHGFLHNLQSTVLPYLINLFLSLDVKPRVEGAVGSGFLLMTSGSRSMKRAAWSELTASKWGRELV